MSELSKANKLLRGQKYKAALEIYEKICNENSFLSTLVEQNMAYARKKLREKTCNIYISIVTPAYNADKFIEKTILSIINQDYTNFELLIIDDGSIDSTSNIAKKWADADARVKHIRKENGGFASAINLGIEKASGQYILFVEADDWIESDMLSASIEAIQKYDADFTRSLFKVHYSNKAVVDNYIERCKIPLNQTISIHSAPATALCQLGYWTGIYKTEFLRKNKIYLYEDDRIPLYQDTILNYKMFLAAKRIIYIDKVLYNYNSLDENLGQSIKNIKYPMSVKFLFEKMDRYKQENQLATPPNFDFTLKAIHLGFHLKRVALQDKEMLFEYAQKELRTLSKVDNPFALIDNKGLLARIRCMLNGKFSEYYDSYLKLPTGRGCNEIYQKRILIMQFFPLYSLSVIALLMKEEEYEKIILVDENNAPSYFWANILSRLLLRTKIVDKKDIMSREGEALVEFIGVLESIYINFTDKIGYRGRILDAYPDVPIFKVAHGVGDYFEDIELDLIKRIKRFFLPFDFGINPLIKDFQNDAFLQKIPTEKLQDAFELVNSNKTRVPQNNATLPDKSKVVLLVHQNLSLTNLVTTDDECKLYETIVSKLISDGCFVVFKEHYYSETEIGKKLTAKHRDRFRLMITDKYMPLELYFKWIQANVGAVLSIYSTALFTLRSLGYKRCFTVFANELSGIIKYPKYDVLTHNFISLQLVALEFEDFFEEKISKSQKIISIAKNVDLAYKGRICTK